MKKINFVNNQAPALNSTNLNQLQDNVEDAISNIANIIYPIGSIYMSINDVDPSTLFGGTWEQIKDTFLLACGSKYANGATGGEAEHTLTEAEMPKHRHSGGQAYASTSGVFARLYHGEDGTKLADEGYTGGSQPHNNMPPYLAVYVWKRTA